ncbi:MAG: endoribonuclease MazF [Gammaproteobacteria bacterium]|nr:endoribonuclease MazF [Gammaproteobacteria bacterium]
MVAAPYVPERGDLIWLEFSPQAGHEQAGRRPALVVSPRLYNERSSVALLCPVTSTPRGYAFEVVLPADSPVTGVVLSDQVRSLDWRARHARFRGRAPRTVVAEVLEKARTLLD